MIKSNLHTDKYGVYIHIPFCKSKCAYCAFVSTPEISLQRRYIDALVSEVNSCPRASVDTVYVGGGTPSCLYRGALETIFDAVYDKFEIDGASEITVEANPESCDAEFVKEIRACGVNRISLGLQSANDKILRAIGRIHTLYDFRKAVEILKCGGIDNISSDLILGLPEQNVRDVENALDIICADCAHASVYALSVEEGTPLFFSGYKPDDDAVADLYDFAVRRLYDYGFARYEVSNFARPARQSKHNIKYWTCKPYIGLGVAAHGYDGAYVRYAHGNDVREYLENQSPEKCILTEKDRYNEYVMLSLRTDYGLDLSDFSEKFGYDFTRKNAVELKKLELERLVIVDKEKVKLPFDKMFVMNGIIERLME